MVRLFYASLCACFFFFSIVLSTVTSAWAATPDWLTKKAPVADTTAVPEEQQRYLMYTFYNAGYDGDPNFSWTSIETAIQMGFNGIMLAVPWDQIYPTRNGPANWATLDKQIARITQLGAKVGLLVGLQRDKDRVDTFWPSDGYARTYKNEILYKAHAYQFSPAHQPTVNLANDFVRQVAQRYNDQQQQGHILFISVVTSPIMEQEYSPTSEVLYQAGETGTVLDYSKSMIAGFQTWLTTKYSTIGALNAAWSKGYSSFNDVQPPGLNAGDINAAFAGKPGKDWYVYRHKVQKAFVDQTTQTIKSVNSTYKVINQHGAVYDELSLYRGTLDFKNYAQNTDGVKVNDTPYYLHRFSMDLLRSNISPGKWVMNEVDGIGYARVGLQTYIDQVTQSFTHGAKVLTFSNFADAGGLSFVRQVIQQIRAQGWLNQPVPAFNPSGTISVKLSQLVETGYTQLGVTGQWTQTYNQNGSKPVRITIDEDIMDATPITPTPVSSLTLLPPVVDCSTGSLTFKTAGGDGTPIEFMSIGLQDWSTTATATIDLVQRTGVTFTLKARQSGKEISYDYTTTCPVAPVNKPPVLVSPVPAQTVAQGSSYSLTIPATTFADSDGTLTGWAVSVLPPGLTFNAATRTISGTATTVGTSQVTLTVTDNGGASAQQAITFVVTAPVSPTTTTPVSPTTTTPSLLSILAPAYDCTTGRLVFKTRGGDGSLIDYLVLGITGWRTDSVLIIDAWQRNGTTLTLDARQNDRIVTYTFTTACAPSNKPPVVVTPLASQTATLGRSYSFVIPAATFSDPDGQLVSWSAANLPVGLTFDATTHTISGVPSLIGPNSVTITVTDNAGASVQTSFILQVLGTNSTPIAPAAPTALSLVVPEFNCTTGRLVFKTSGGDGTLVEYFAVGIKAWSKDSVGFVDPWLRDGVTFTLQARQSGRQATFTFRTSCLSNKPPVVVTPLASQTATLGRSYSFVIPAATFSDPDGQLVSWSAANLPVGLTFDATTHTISGVPSLIGPNSVTITVTDNGGASVQTSFILQVLGTNSTPIAPAAPTALSLVAPEFNCTTGRLVFKTSGGDGTLVEYFAVGIKAWSKDSVGFIDPWQREGVTFTLQARQSGRQATFTFRTSCLSNKPPVVVTPLASQTATLGRSYSFVIPAATFSDPDGQLVSWSAANLPVGLTFDATTHTISGVPTSLGPTLVILTVVDNLGASVQTTFMLLVVNAGTGPRGVTPASGVLTLLAPDFDCATGKLTFKTSGGDGTPIDFMAVGIMAWSKDSVSFIDPWLRDGVTFVLKAHQSGKDATYSFTTACSASSPNGRVAAPDAESVSWQAWPNPVEHELTVAVPATVTTATLRVVLSTMSGLMQEGVVGATRVEHGQVRLTLPGLQTGMYLLHIYDGEQRLHTLKVFRR